MALADLAAASHLPGWVFFDRGLIDAASALEQLTGEPARSTIRESQRYHPRVFLAPPWPEIYVTDAERRHGFAVAVAEYRRLLDVYPSLGYEVVILPKVGVAERADLVLRTLARSEPPGRPSAPA
jgi:predicted ATPase